jgi:hypothetical protein
MVCIPLQLAEKPLAAGLSMIRRPGRLGLLMGKRSIVQKLQSF